MNEDAEAALDEILDFISNGPSQPDATEGDLAWACDFAQRKSELDAVLASIPIVLERGTPQAALSTIRTSVSQCLLRYCGILRSELAPYPDNERIAIYRDAYALILYLAGLTLARFDKVPIEPASERLVRLRHSIDRIVQETGKPIP